MLSLTGGLLGLIIGAALGLTGAGVRPRHGHTSCNACGAAATLGALQGLRKGVVRYRAAMMLAAAGAVTAPLLNGWRWQVHSQRWGYWYTPVAKFLWYKPVQSGLATLSRW